jgi:hypothetical protein
MKMHRPLEIEEIRQKQFKGRLTLYLVIFINSKSNPEDLSILRIA